jgi:hypothetical protein
MLDSKGQRSSGIEQVLGDEKPPPEPEPAPMLGR